MRDYPRPCSKCSDLLGEEAFAVDRSKASGRKSHCKACDRERAKSYYLEHRDERRAQQEAKRDAEAVAAMRRRVEERRQVYERRVAKGLERPRAVLAMRAVAEGGPSRVSIARP
jgi:hypothetical protein